MMLPHRDKWDVHHAQIDELVYIGRDVFVMVASTLALYNAIELLTLIYLTFKRKSGLYFWSILIASFGLIPYCLGWLIVYFDLTHDYVGMIIETVGWVLVISGQSVVLYSRLHLITSERIILRSVLAVIIVNGLVWHTTMTVLLFGSEYSPKDNRNGFNNVFNIAEKISMSCFYMQELTISGIYIWKSLDILKTAFGSTRTMLYKLFAINIAIVIMDIAMVVIELMDFYVWEQGIKLVTYSIKLKLEFAVLSELIEFVRSRSGTQSRPTKPSQNQSTFVPLSAVRRSSTKPTGFTGDRIYSGDTQTNITIAATHPAQETMTGDRIHVVRQVDVESLNACPYAERSTEELFEYMPDELPPELMPRALMDPLSLAVSVVPVAEQLVKTIKTIKKLISTYKSAAKELETLTSRLGHVEVICESIGTVLETACLSKNLSEARLPTSLYQMIHECYEKVTVIHDVIQNVTEKRDGGCRRFSNEGLLFLQHKDRIIASTKGLDKSLEYLHLLLTTSIFTMSISCPPAPEVTTSNKNSPSNQSSILVAPSQKIDSNCIDTSPISTDTTTQPKQVETISEGWRRSFLQFAFLQKTRKRNVITETGGSGPSVTNVDSVLTVGSTWLNWYMKLSLRKDHLTPLCVTLTLPLVIPVHYWADSLGARVRDAFGDDNVEAVQQLFNE
ncbi:hypothetical protein FGRA07_08805 [Fusarium graminearum]|nr:hypothetical protein FGRA07_08805 [Fusarium graminearum]